MNSIVSARQPLAGQDVRACREGMPRATRRRSGPRPRRRRPTSCGAEERVARRHLERAPRRRRGERHARSPCSLVAERSATRARARRRSARRSSRAALADPEDRDDDVLGGELEVDVVLARASARRRDGRWRRCPRTSTDEPQRIPGEHAGGASISLVEHVEPGDLADLARAARRSEASVSCEQLGAVDGRHGGGSRRASAVSSALGLVDSMQRHRRGRRLGRRCGRRSPTCRIADWVRLPTILWVEERTTSAPQSRALVGSASEKCRWAPQASSTTSGTSRSWATSASAATSAHGAEVGGRDDDAPPTASGSASSAACSALRASGSGRRRARGRSRARRSAARSPARTRPSIDARVDVALNHDPLAAWRSAMQVAWLPREPPLTRNQLRRAPQASAASSCACWNGASAVGADVDALDQRRDVELEGARRRSPRAAPGRRRGRPCGPGRGSARARGRRRRRARRDTGVSSWCHAHAR